MEKDYSKEYGLCFTCKHCDSSELIEGEKRIKYKCMKPRLKNLNMGEVLHCVYYEKEKHYEDLELNKEQQKEVDRLINRKGGLYEKTNI